MEGKLHKYMIGLSLGIINLDLYRYRALAATKIYNVPVLCITKFSNPYIFLNAYDIIHIFGITHIRVILLMIKIRG